MTDAPPTTIHGLVQGTAAKYGDRPAFAYPERLVEMWDLPGAEITWSALLADADRLAAAYGAAGYGPGHRIAILVENRPDHFRHWLALNALGVSMVPVNPDYRLEELRYLLGHSEASLAVALPPYLPLIQEAIDSAGLACRVVTPDAVLGGPPPPPTAAGDTPVGAETEAALLFTSGTTGMPKGCILTNAYFRYWGERYSSEGGHISLRPGEDRLLQPLPTFYINAIGNSFMGMATIGGCQVQLDRFHPRSWWDEAVETKATCFHYLGVMPAMLLNLPAGPNDTAHSLRYGMGGGVDPKHHLAFEERFGTVLCEGFAMTEGGGTSLFVDAVEPRKRGTRCMGYVRPHQEARLVDDDGNDIEGAGAGELLLRHAGPDHRKGFFSGYYKEEAATAEAWEGGWFHTGDVIRREADGSLYFVERKKNIIRRSGTNIAPAEIELVLRRHDAVADVAVVATPDPIRGDEVLAFVTLAPGATGDASLAETLFDYCFEQLAYYKAPGYVAFLDALPVTSTQKVKKAEATALARSPDKLDACFDFRDRKKRSAPAPSDNRPATQP